MSIFTNTAKILPQILVSLIFLTQISCALKSNSSNLMENLMFFSLGVNSQTGGKVSLAGNANEATLYVPAGALEENASIDIQRLEKPPVQNDIIPLQAAYTFSPEDLQFLVPATLTVCYNSKELQDQGLSEDTVEIYYVDPQTGDYASLGGNVDRVHHCVSAQVEHFSTYIPAARALVSGNNPPRVGNPTFLPSRPLAGLPLRVRSIITDQEPGNTGAIVSANLYYRVTGSGAAFTKLPMHPDFTDASSERYYADIPAVDVTLSGLDYYIEAMDNLGQIRTAPRNAPTRFSTRSISDELDTANPLRLTPSSAMLNISAGFSRDFTIQAKVLGQNRYFNTAPGVYSYFVKGDSPTKVGSIKDELCVLKTGCPEYDVVNQIAPSTLRLTVGTKGIGYVNVSSDIYTATQLVNVHAGNLTSIRLFDDMGIQITGPVDILAGSTFQFDALGYDFYGNKILLLPNFTADANIGSINADGLFTAGNSFPETGFVTAELGGITAKASVNIFNPSFSVGGTVSGLTAGILTLENNGEEISISTAGAYAFPTKVFSGSSYNVAVTRNPEGLFCSVVNGSGIMGTADVLNADVQCIPGDFWTQKTAMPTPRYSPGTVVLPNGNILVMGGRDAAGNFLTAVEEYNPEANTWAVKSSMLTARVEFTAILSGNKVFILGGWDRTDLSTAVDIYDISTGTWTTGSPLPSRRYYVSFTEFNGKIYALGGIDGLTFLPVSTAEVYNIQTNTWETLPSMPTTADTVRSAAVNGIIYVVTGARTSGTAMSTPAMSIFDPSSGSWGKETLQSIKLKVSHKDFFLNSDKKSIYITGGTPVSVGVQYKEYSSVLNEVYDISTNTWSLKSDMPYPISEKDRQSVISQSRIYFTYDGGLNKGSTFGGFTIYDTQLDLWKVVVPTEKIVTTISYLKFTAHPSGKIYGFGGMTTGTPEASTQVWEYIP